MHLYMFLGVKAGTERERKRERTSFNFVVHFIILLRSHHLAAIKITILLSKGCNHDDKKLAWCVFEYHNSDKKKPQKKQKKKTRGDAKRKQDLS